MSTSRPLSLAALAAVGPLFIIVACGGGAPDPKTAGAGGEPTATTAATSEPTSAPTTTASADDDDLEDDSIPTSDVVCKHIADVLKGKAGALSACIAELEKKQDDDVNYYVCYSGCTMAATTGEAVEACKAKCKK